MNILTHYINPPIPVRDFDWSATTNDYEPGAPVGYGKTEDAAIQNLKSILEVKASPGLMAAAPELLEALRHVIQWHDQLIPSDIERYRAVVAKATEVTA